MRELKFRAWDTLLGIMVYQKNTIGNKCAELSDFFAIYEQRKIPCIMQYTGLKDKNGKEIYEGDIVEKGMLGVDNEGEIFDEICNFGIKFSSKWAKFYLGGTNYLGIPSRDVRVIGNIYENPEIVLDN